ncbi:hypothetical protein VP01_2732g3 [Puccinia sorghi]|uniref:No apical meristem-associated C-terminal domain-containing protein n=1 Tax=Puccinia sorghi TaxID=27349 RepID=A0A0L6V376_9BASI|nr:hypothetical protein VP01_2732g3 [Puccinia sorghi]
MDKRRKKKKRKDDDVNLSHLIKGQKELLDISCKKQKSFNDFANDMLISKDLTGMDEETFEYFRIKRHKAIPRAKSEE